VKFFYVTDRAAIGDERLQRVLESLRGAAGLLVQVREKNETDRTVLQQTRSARANLGPTVPLLVNRRFDLALAGGADGVHLPAAGLPVSRVRAATSRGFRIGVSTHSADDAVRAIEEGADLVVLGPIFETPSKPSARPLGAGALARLPPRRTHGADVFAIGGIDESRLSDLLPFADRISGVAGIRLIQEAEDPRAVVERIAAA
jgi:thiamine-phosphate pyrophosphorylase